MSDLLEKLVLGEVAGKNAAIHAYDSIIWKVRTGFITLLFIGWAVLLKSIVEDPAGSVGRLGVVCVSMLLFSLFLALGGWLIDRNYMHRKFRVILALNALTDAIKKSSGNPEAVPADLLKVSGDDGEMSYLCPGYKQAHRTGLCIFFLPLLALAIAASVILSSNGVTEHGGNTERRQGPKMNTTNVLRVDPLKSGYDYLVRDGSEMRLLVAGTNNSACRCRLAVGGVSSAVQHKMIEEIWYRILEEGQVWRKLGGVEIAIEFKPGISLVIPTGADIQFKSSGGWASTVTRSVQEILDNLPSHAKSALTLFKELLGPFGAKKWIAVRL